MNKAKKRWMAASKMIGIIIGALSGIVILYSMVMMAVLKDLSPLPTLLGGILGVLGTYIGFYINMAKAEHIADKKNELRKELARIDKKRDDPSITEDQKEELDALESSLNEEYNKLQEMEDEDITVNTEV